MGDATRDRLSDAGSIPARSIVKTPYLRRFFFFMMHFVLYRCEICVYFLLLFSGQILKRFPNSLIMTIRICSEAEEIEAREQKEEII